jgi:hypothetical protein
MKRLISNTGSALALALVAFTGFPSGSMAQGGLTPVFFPAEDPGPPFYARIDSKIYGNEEWVAAVFYREPDCVPADFNLLDQFTPLAFGCQLTIEGMLLIPEEGGAPKVLINEEMEAVPVWFVPRDVYVAAIADGELKIAELAALDGLLVGYATHFSEVIHPRPHFGTGLGGHPVFKLIINAHGILEDGRVFKLHITRVEEELRTVRIQFK